MPTTGQHLRLEKCFTPKDRNYRRPTAATTPPRSRNVKGNHRNPQILRVGAEKLVAAALASQQDENSVSQAGASQQLQDNVGIETVAPDNPPKPTLRGAYKLTERLISALEQSIAEVPDGPIEMHVGCCGIDRSTFYEWRKLGREMPGSVYEEFAQRIEAAMFASWKKLHAMAAEQKPFEVLVRRHGELYPSEAMRLQLSGEGGMPLFPGGVGNPFTVRIELATGPEGARSVETAI
jgi:hypothetical protein